MGMAYTAVAEGPDALYYNPGGLAGSDYTQVQGGAGRMISPVGLVAFETLSYIRPLPVLPGATIGAGFFSLRQNSGGDKDEFLFHGSYQRPFPQVYINKPVKFGANLKVLDVDPGQNNKKFGVALDGGAILDTGGDFKAGISLTDLSTQLGVPNPSFNLGGAYRAWRRVTFAMDVRVRRNLTQLFPGMEVDLYQQLLQFRLGKGLPIDGITTYAFGFGVNFSPLIIDFAMGLPAAGVNREGGASQISLTYKFGAPAFYGRYIGSAARRAEDLRSDILELEERRKALQAQSAAAETDRTGTESQVRTLEQRLKDLQDKVREAEAKLEREEYDLSHAQPKPEPKAVEPPPKPAPPRPKVQAAPAFPRTHLVKSGETLRSIAKEYYGDPGLWEKIYEANPDKVERGLPVEGKVMTIPAPGERAAPASAPGEPQEPSE